MSDKFICAFEITIHCIVHLSFTLLDDDNGARSVRSIGSDAFASCSRLNLVVVSPTAVDIGSNAFYGDRSLTGIDATIPVCEKLLKSCNGTCTQINGCFTPSSAPTRSPSNVPSGSPAAAPASAAGLSGGIIAAIVIGATLAVALVVALLFWCYYRTPVSYTHLTLPTNREV